MRSLLITVMLCPFIPAFAQDALTDWTVLTARTARWEDEANLERGEEQFGAEHNPTGNPIGGGEGYDDIFSSGDFTVHTSAELRKALEQARAGQVVFIPGDAEIDMTESEKLTIPAGVTVASTRGLEGSPGALIRSANPAVKGMLVAGGDYVRITGLRVQGPHPDQSDAIYYQWGLGTTHFATEIDNCEVSGFSFAGIYVRGGARRAYVHHCFIHHNQQAGLGYGVAVDDADVLVEANRFDWGRHYITGANGNPGTGFEARYNICGPQSIGHLFDMHGQASASGIAGDWMNIHHNTFIGDKIIAIGIRGTPSQGAFIHHNWFQNPRATNALFAFAGSITSRKMMLALRWSGELLGIGNVHTYRNVFGEERRLTEGVFFDDSVLIETEKSLKGLSATELLEVARLQRSHLPAAAADETQQKPLAQQSPEELLATIMQGLRQAAEEAAQ